MGITITDQKSCWDLLKETELPIFMYGMGLGAEKILSVFHDKGITCAGFFASSGFVRGHQFKGHLVHTLQEIEEKVDDFIIVLAFAAGYDPLYSDILKIAERHTLVAPDVPVAGDGLFDREYFERNRDLFERVYDLLADERSKTCYENIINFKITGDPKFLQLCTSGRDEVYDELMTLKDDMVFVDLGAYKGDTALEFSEACEKKGVKYKTIYAFEPNSKNYTKLVKNTSDLNIKCYNAAAYDESGKIGFTENEGRMARISDEGIAIDMLAVDDIVEEDADIIKLDVEGAEYMALRGAASHIRRGAELMCALYHRNEDMFKLPLYINDLAPDLKLYIRHELYIPAWETNLYAVKG
ncbi:MAG: FkbM family methyltransferase [Clostridiales bacterium]|nr:FkbM family methyltransferase [Clostridiales bacterium]